MAWARLCVVPQRRVSRFDDVWTRPSPPTRRTHRTWGLGPDPVSSRGPIRWAGPCALAFSSSVTLAPVPPRGNPENAQVTRHKEDSTPGRLPTKYFQILARHRAQQERARSHTSSVGVPVARRVPERHGVPRHTAVPAFTLGDARPARLPGAVCVSGGPVRRYRRNPIALSWGFSLSWRSWNPWVIGWATLSP